MPAKFFPAPDVEEIGRELIRENHEELNNHNVRVEFCFCSDTPKKNGKQVWGTAQKIGGKAAFLYGFKEAKRHPMSLAHHEALNEEFFLITISEPIWDRLDKKPEMRRALVDHELMHCTLEEDENGDMKLKLLGHDFEGFTKEIERYGLWREDAKAMAGAMNAQMNLPLEVEADGVESVTLRAGGQSVTMSRKNGKSAPGAVAH